ncbi:MAG: hypothetical protein IJM15_03765 [Erysipelotrichaceae bacterium]|nr:hypothetical protein [Erysipelotrichaceae bacterium]
MPYVQFTTNKHIFVEQEEELLDATTSLIDIISGKKPESTMVAINDDLTMMFKLNNEPCMKIDVYLYNEASFEDRRRYAEELMSRAALITGIDASRIYLTYSTFDHWGRDGILKGK